MPSAYRIITGVSKLFENILIIITMALWSSVATIVFVNFLVFEDKRRKIIKEMGRIYLWIVMIFTSGSFVFLLGEKTWHDVLSYIATHAGEFRVTLSFGVWFIGGVLLVHLLRLVKEKLG